MSMKDDCHLYQLVWKKAISCTRLYVMLLLSVLVITSGIADLCHDFGKADDLFQVKLAPNTKTEKHYETYRYKWVALKIFAAFVADQSDQQWLTKWETWEDCNENKWLEKLSEIRLRSKRVACLIAIHHLGMYPFLKIIHHDSIYRNQANRNLKIRFLAAMD